MNGLYLVAGAAAAVAGGLSVYAMTHKNELNADWEQGHFHIDNLCTATLDSINAELNRDYTMLNLSRDEISKKLHLQLKLRNATRNACLGDGGSREYLKRTIADILTKRLGVDPKTINYAIPFDEPDSMSAQDKFEYMYALYRRDHGTHAMEKLMEETGFAQPKKFDGWENYYIDEDDVFEAFDRMEKPGTYVEQLEVLVQRIYQILYGHDVSDIFIMDECLDNVSGGIGGQTRIEYCFLEERLVEDSKGLVSPKNTDMLWIVYRGRLMRLKFESFKRKETLERVCKNIYRYNTRESLSQYNPVVQGTFYNNARIMALCPPVNDGWSFYCRKFTSVSARDLDELVRTAKNYRRHEYVSQIIAALPQCEMNFIFSGNTGGGKTSDLKAIIRYIDPRYAIRVAETSFELNLNNIYPERNIECLQERGNVTIEDIVRICRRLDTDVLIVGECNEPKIAGAWVQVGQSLSKFVVTTIHTNTLAAAIEYLRNALVALDGLPAQIAEKQVVDILNFDVHQVHDAAGNHFVERISEVVPYSAGEYPEDLNAATVEFYRRMTDRKLYEENVIAVFDRDKEEYRICNNISDYTYNRMVEKVGKEIPDRLRALIDKAIAEQEAEAAGVEMSPTEDVSGTGSVPFEFPETVSDIAITKEFLDSLEELTFTSGTSESDGLYTDIEHAVKVESVLPPSEETDVIAEMELYDAEPADIFESDIQSPEENERDETEFLLSNLKTKKGGKGLKKGRRS